MYRIRFHGRGGQGMKTASRILGSAFFREGFEVQDAPRYGAERRGAPISAYVRAARQPVFERGVVRVPDLVLVADDTLVAMPLAGVMQGISASTALLIVSETGATIWAHRLNHRGALIVLPPVERFVGVVCAGAAARLLGVIGRAALKAAVSDETVGRGDEVLSRNLEAVSAGYDAVASQAGTVSERAVVAVPDALQVDWIDFPLDSADAASPSIYAGATSVEVRTGLWRTLRPVIDYEHCKRCWWVCSEFCPDSAIRVRADQAPEIDYDHCKGCLICLEQCPSHAIGAVPEREQEASP